MKKITSILFIFLSQFCFSQFSCGTSDEPIEKEMHRRQTLKKIAASKKSDKTSVGTTYIAVKPHLIGKDDGTGY